MVAEMRAGQDKQPYSPPLHSWSPEAAMGANILDAINGLRHVTVAMKAKNPPAAPKPFPRPKTAYDAAEKNRRKSAHEALAARMLPHKRAKGAQRDS